MSNLPEEYLNELKEAFEAFDTDGNGVIKTTSLSNVNE
jgi:Ca2+-binding EF-hand superfamily protein